MLFRSAVAVQLLVLAGCGSGGDEPAVDPDPTPLSPELEFTLESPPALNGLLWATDQPPDLTADVFFYEYDLYRLDDGSNVIETVNRVTEDSWRVSRTPTVTSDRSLLLFSVRSGDEYGLYAYDPASGGRKLLVPGFIGQVAVGGNRVIAWWEGVRPDDSSPFERHLFVGSLDGSIPATEIAPDASYEVARNGFDLSPDGSSLVWAAANGDGSWSLAAAPTDDPSAQIVLAELPEDHPLRQPEFIDADRVVYEGADSVMLTRLSEPGVHTRVDVEPDPGFRRGASTLVHGITGASLVYQVSKAGRANPDFRRNLMVVSLDSPGIAQRANPEDVVVAHDPGRATGTIVWDLSDDGRWLAWISLDGADLFSLWLSDLATPASDAQRLGAFTRDDAFRFVPGSSHLIYTAAGSVHRVTPGHPFATMSLAELPDEGRVISLRGLADGLHYLLNIEPDGWYGRRLWVGSLDGRPARILIPGSPTDAWRELEFFQFP